MEIHLPNAISSLTFTILCLQTLVQAQFTPGQTYMGTNGYIEYHAGDLPIIVSAPHGGYVEPASIPDRNCSGCVTGRDSRTEEMAYQIDSAVQILFGGHPHIIINKLARIKLDANREIIEAAQGDLQAELAWAEYHAYIQTAKDSAKSNFGSALYIDLHGHGHPIQRIELGYLISRSQLQNSNSSLDAANLQNSSSIRHLNNVLNPSVGFSEILRGNECMGEFLVEHGYPATPSASDTAPAPSDPYFNGGYNTVRHGSRDSSDINGIQFELNWTGVRNTSANRKTFAMSLACAMRDYLDKWFFDLDAWDPGNIVTSTLDQGPGSLREALLGAEDGEVVSFAPSLFGDTIRLEKELRICSQVTIEGPGDSLLAISGGESTRLLRVLKTDSVHVSGLSWVKGKSPIGEDGGGIWASGNLSMEDCTLANNYSGDDGGAMRIDENGDVLLKRCIVRDNSCDDDGAGIRNFSGELFLDECHFQTNGSPSFGGGISSNGFVSILNSTFSSNSAASAGGGVRSFGGIVQIENSTFTSNSAGDRGGAISSSADLELNFVSIVSNTATNEGGGLEFSGALCSLHNTLLAANQALNGPDAFANSSGSFTSLGHNLVSDSTDSGWLFATADQLGNALSPIDPLTLPLSFNGGPTPTVPLAPGSPCIDTADSIGVPPNDQRGEVRSYNGLPDIGAFEYQPPVALSGLAQENTLQLFPNPARTQLNIELPLEGDYEIQVGNLLGQVLWQEYVVNAKKTSIDVTQWAAGPYWIRVNGIVNQTLLFLVREH